MGIVLPALGFWTLSRTGRCPVRLRVSLWLLVITVNFLLLALPTERWLLQAVGIVIVGCPWHYFSWLFMALFLLAFHGIIVILAMAIGEWPVATLSHFVPCSFIFSAGPLITLPSFAKVWAGLPIGHLYVCMYVCMYVCLGMSLLS